MFRNVLASAAFAAVAVFGVDAGASTITTNWNGSQTNDINVVGPAIGFTGTLEYLGKIDSGDLPSASQFSGDPLEAFAKTNATGGEILLTDTPSALITEFGFISIRLFDPIFESGDLTTFSAEIDNPTDWVLEAVVLKAGNGATVFFDNMFNDMDVQNTVGRGNIPGISHITFFGSRTTVVPLPAALPLLLTALVGLVALKTRKGKTHA